ncbi:phage tail spike protein [Marinilactibacillus psychrotolerans]|uniref:phage tail spike protein n=1 Tax=Marinilactibacillus psychrotolerans TaxID=191770 RepID=UPI003886C474
MITTLNLNRDTTAVLENAYGVSYEKTLNQLWIAEFSLPLSDEKKEKVKQLQYIEIIDDDTDEYVGLFRVMPKLTKNNDSDESITYKCEHVLGTLIGNTLFKYHQLTNYTTEGVLIWLLNQQKVKHWKVGKVDIKRYFHYSWENENLLSALFSVPQPFDESYMWTWDTSSYPWTLNLEKTDTEPTGRIAEGYNLTGLEIEENPNSLWNRIYPLGAGEGVNKLDISDVNIGLPYVEDVASIKEHGLYETTWVDQRFIDAASLKSTAESMLESWSKPTASLIISAVDLSGKTGIVSDKLRLGKVIRVFLEEYDEIDLLIVKEGKKDLYGDPSDIELELGTLSEDQQDSDVNSEQKQKINELYSQGATNIMNFGYQDNCDSVIPALIPFYVDDDVVNINTCELTFRTKKFRAYSQATKGGGAVVESTSAGGGTTKSTTSGGSVSTSTASGGGSAQTSSSGGGSTQTSTSNGQSTQTSSASGTHRHVMFQTTGTTDMEGQHVAATTANGVAIILGPGTPGMSEIETLEAADNHSHSVSTPAHRHSLTIPSHTHSVSIPSHKHDFEIPNHSHDVTIPAHTHDISLPNHTHDVEHKITELDATPSKVTIRVDGNTVPATATSADRLDLVEYMSKDDSGKITRGRHEIEITPDGLARIEADLILRVFIRSQLGGNF